MGFFFPSVMMLFSIGMFLRFRGMRKKTRIRLYFIFYKWELKFFSSSIVTLPQTPDLHQYNMKLISAIMAGTQILILINLLYLLAFKVLLFCWIFLPQESCSSQCHKIKVHGNKLVFVTK